MANNNSSSSNIAEYNVRDIIDYRPSDSHYLVRWVGYPQPTWEPLSNLAHCRESLNDFLRASRALTPLSKFLLFEEAVRAFRERLGGSPVKDIVNDVDFDAPPSADELTLGTEMVYGRGVARPSSEFLSGCGEDCRCAGGRNACDCEALSGADDSANVYDEDGRLQVFGCAIFECNVNCRCTNKCRNRVTQRKRAGRCALALTKLPDVRGWGIVALAPIPANTFIDRYLGEMITSAEAEKRTKQGLNAYLFDLDWNTTVAAAGAASRGKQDGALCTVDARCYGSVSRFFNHSCEPNLRVVPVFVECHDPSMHGVAFFTARDIAEGEQLCFDYTGGGNCADPAASSSGSLKEKKKRCLCGSLACKKYIYI